MEFEEKFPSLQEYIFYMDEESGTVYHMPENDGYDTVIVETHWVSQHCLDKQRIWEAIEKHADTAGSLVWKDELLEELGLDDD